MDIDKDKLIEKLLDILSRNSEAMESMAKEMAELRKELEVANHYGRVSSKPFLPLMPAVTSSPLIGTPVCVHEYPKSWSGTSTPSCIKCGRCQPLPVSGSVSISGGSISLDGICIDELLAK